MKRFIQLCLLFVLFDTTFAENWWRARDAGSRARPDPQAEAWIRPHHAEVLTLDAERMATALREIVEQGGALEVDLPTGPGTFLSFNLSRSSVMSPDLAARYPEILTLRGEAPDQPGTWARIDWTPQGFHGMIHTPAGFIYIDPWTRDDQTTYACYLRKGFARDEAANDIHCARAPGLEPRAFRDAPTYLNAPTRRRSLPTTTLRTYRLAVTADHQYTEFHGGEVNALAAIVTGVNRVNGIYEREVGVRMQLVANNDLLIFNATNDPHTGSHRASGIINDEIGILSYDIGHYVSGRNSGSLSALGVVCNIAEKGDGKSASATPNNDPYWVDIVSHEIGHQFGADHTFNSVISACGGGNRAAGTAYEPGSGTTIMSYAGICGADNLQSVSDDYFHASSIMEIQSYIAGSSSCGTVTNTTNHPPEANAGNDFIIPARTPFVLTGVGTDSDNDTLTYTWEQFDLGPTQSLTAGDNGQSPLFRSMPPDVSPRRSLPELNRLLSGASNPGEKLPTTSRTLHFQFTVRDNFSSGGGVAQDDMSVQVIDTTAPFGILDPNTAVSLSGAHTVIWNTGNSQNAPISVSQVRILLSIDGGLSFPLTLAASTANDGSESINLPPLTTNMARIRIEAIGNIFFDVSGSNFSITPSGNATPFFTGIDPQMVIDSFGTGNANGRVDPGEFYILFHPKIQNAGSSATNLQATLTAITPGLTVIHEPSTFPNLAPGQQAVSHDPFIFSLDASHLCGDPIAFQLEVLSDQGGNTLTLELPTGTGQSIQSIGYSSYAGSVPALAIPDNDPLGINIPLQVSGMSPDLSVVRFRIGGNACSSGLGNTGNGITHDFPNDLIIKLTSPEGTTVTVMQNPGVGIDAGPNLCSVELLDSATMSIQAIPDEAGPHVGNYLPFEELSTFNGEDPNGTWTINVADTVFDKLGTIQELSLTLESVTICSAPAVTNNLDGDADGLSDEWERFYFNNPTSTLAQVDGDLDFATNLDEFITDTDPTNDQSYFKVDAFALNGNLAFQTSPLRNYRLQSASIPFAINWKNDALLNGNGGVMSFPITPGPYIRFYRVRVELP